MPTGQRATPARKATPAKAEAQGTSATSSPEVEVSSQTEEELSQAQREIEDLKDQLAKAKGAKDPELEYGTVENPGDEKNILIHFVRDGFCELGTVWYRGQELELEPGTPAYNGAKSWANLSADEQEEIYGEVYFRKGEWKGKAYEDKAATEAERRRGRAVPRSTD
jgi:hypothetical protein